jgi:Uma2 family endonuclease
MSEYATFGVRWYWIVDPEARSLDVYARGADGRYALAQRWQGPVSADIVGCDGLMLDLAAMWRKVDSLLSG